MITSSLIESHVFDDSKTGVVIDLSVDTRRLGPGRVDHGLLLEASRAGQALWTKRVRFALDAPFDVPDLATLDPFVIAALFPVMEVGGVLRVHGSVSRTLIRNVLDFQSAWHRGAPGHCRLFSLESADIDDTACPDVRPYPRAILAFSGDVDSILALCRNVSGEAGVAGHEIGATLAIEGPGIGVAGAEDRPAAIADLRAISGRWSVPMAVVETDIAKAVDKHALSHGTWVAACLSLFAGRFDVGLMGSLLPSFSEGFELFGRHPLLDPLLSGGEMTIRDDEGLLSRVEKVAALGRFSGAADDLRVCLRPTVDRPNCCHCERCVNTMLCFVATGQPIPPAFPKGLRLGDIGIGMGDRYGLYKAGKIIEFARQNGTDNARPIQVLKRRYRVNQTKVRVTNAWRRLASGKPLPRWHVLDQV